MNNNNRQMPAPDSASSQAMFNMMLHFKAAADAAEQRCIDLQQRNTTIVHELWAKEARILGLDHQITVQNRRLQQAVSGGEMITRACDQWYTWYHATQRNIPRLHDYDEEITRIMIRADIGFDMIHGPIIVDEPQNDQETVVDSDTESEL
jgi:hypothetical protein